MFKPKPLTEQTLVITGATSGIGLVTARLAAERGANLVLIARSEQGLAKLADELNAKRPEGAIYQKVDVADEAAVKRAARAAVDRFGGIDTWVNNAGVSIYGRLAKVADEDSRRLFDTNFWGVVNGSLAAVDAFGEKGGTLINVGSTLSDRAIPIQGMYCASKHAVKGFTDALRMELEADKRPINVSLVKPAAIDTPYKSHAKNYMGVRPENPPPVYAPETVAETILHCAENSVRDVFVGAGGKALSAMGSYFPRVTDFVMEQTMIDIQKTGEPPYESDALHEAGAPTLDERGGYDGHVAESSLYTTASLHPVAAGSLIGIGAGIAALAVFGTARAQKRRAAGRIDTTWQPEVSQSGS